MFIAAAAACLVASASSWDGAWGGDPEFIDHTRPFFYVWVTMEQYLDGTIME
jgi:hypothetical protein